MSVFVSVNFALQCCILYILVCFGFVFICIRTFSSFLFDFVFDPLAVQKLVNFHKFVSFLVSLLPLIYSFIPLWSENKHGVISVFLNLVHLLCDLPCAVSWRTFLVYSRRMYILLLFGGMSISFMVFRSPTPYWSECSIHYEVEYWNLLLLLCNCFSLQFCNFLMHIFKCSDVGCLFTCVWYILFMNWTLYHYIITLFASCDSF